MHHPWEEIKLEDYEQHMRLDSVFQLQTMNEMMREQLSAYPIRSVMILGVAGGNGLEHVACHSPKTIQTIQTVYGVDINPHYLDACSERYPALQGIFKPICADLTDSTVQLPHADLLLANLLVEYIGYAHFQRIVKQVKPQYISCGIQVDTGKSFVSDSPYLHVFDRLHEIHCPIEENNLISAMQETGYREIFREEKPLPNGKMLLRIDFEPIFLHRTP